MSQQHLLGVAVRRQLDDGIHAVVKGQNPVQPEAVEADVGAAVVAAAGSARAARAVTVSTGASGSSAPHAAARRTAPRKTPTMRQNLLVRSVIGGGMHV